MIDFPRVRYLLNAVPEAVFRAQREWSRATSGGSMLPDPDPPEGHIQTFLRPLTSPRPDRLEVSAIRVSEARERAQKLQNELNDLQSDIVLKMQELEIEGDAKTVMLHRYFDGYGISKIANELLGGKTEKERNRVKYLLKVTENRLNA